MSGFNVFDKIQYSMTAQLALTAYFSLIHGFPVLRFQ